MQRATSCVVSLLLFFLLTQLTDVTHSLCTEEGLLRSTEYWTLVIKQETYTDISKLLITARILQDRVARNHFSPIVTEKDKRKTKNGYGYYFFNKQSTETYVQVYDPRSPLGIIVNYTVNTNPSYDLLKYPYLPVWKPFQPKITDYCQQFHQTECSSSSSSSSSSASSAKKCPLYCRQAEQFNNSMINFDLTLLSSLEEDWKALLSNRNRGEFITISTLRNITSTYPQIPYNEYFDQIDFPQAEMFAYNETLILNGLANPNREVKWLSQPTVQVDIDNPTTMTIYLAVSSPIYLEEHYFGATTMGFKLKWGNTFLNDSANPSPSGFCVAAQETTFTILFSGDRAKKFFQFSEDSLDYSLLNAKNGSLRNILMAAQNLSSQNRVSNIDLALTSTPVSDYGEVMMDNRVFIVSYSPLQLAPFSIFCFVPKDELLNSGSHSLSTTSVNVKMEQEEVMFFDELLVKNTGSVDLQHQIFISPPLESAWLIIRDFSCNSSNSSKQSNNTNEYGEDDLPSTMEWAHLYDYQSSGTQMQIHTKVGETRRLQLIIRSTSLDPGRVTSIGIVMDTKDAQEGWCYVNRTVVKVSVDVDWKITENVFVSWGSAVGVIFTLITSILLLVCAIVLILLICYRKQVWIRTSSPRFCILIVIGSMIGTSSVFFWIGETTDTKCNGRVWFALVGYSLMFSTLLVKNLRVLWIIGSGGSKTSKPDQLPNASTANPVTENKVFPFILIVVVIEIIILILWTSINKLKTETVTRVSYLSPNQMTVRCTGDNLSVWIGLMVAFNGMLLLVGCVLAYKTRRINDSLNESKLIAICVYNILLTSAVIIPLLLFVTLSPNIQVVLISLASYSVFMPVIVLLLFPRFWKIWKRATFLLHSNESTKTQSYNSSGFHLSATK